MSSKKNKTVGPPTGKPTPQEVIKNFFQWNTPEEVKNDITELYHAAISSDIAESWTSKEISNYFFRCKQVAELIDAVKAL